PAPIRIGGVVILDAPVKTNRLSKTPHGFLQTATGRPGQPFLVVEIRKEWSSDAPESEWQYSDKRRPQRIPGYPCWKRDTSGVLLRAGQSPQENGRPSRRRNRGKVELILNEKGRKSGPQARPPAVRVVLRSGARMSVDGRRSRRERPQKRGEPKGSRGRSDLQEIVMSVGLRHPSSGSAQVRRRSMRPEGEEKCVGAGPEPGIIFPDRVGSFPPQEPCGIGAFTPREQDRRALSDERENPA